MRSGKRCKQRERLVERRLGRSAALRPAPRPPAPPAGFSQGGLQQLTGVESGVLGGRKEKRRWLLDRADEDRFRPRAKALRHHTQRFESARRKPLDSVAA